MIYKYILLSSDFFKNSYYLEKLPFAPQYSERQEEKGKREGKGGRGQRAKLKRKLIKKAIKF